MTEAWSEQSFATRLESSLKIRKYEPGKSPYYPRISEQQWCQMRPVLERLHLFGYSRTYMLELLACHYDFRPSRHQLNTRMKVWGFGAQRSGGNGMEEYHTEEAVQATTVTPPPDIAYPVDDTSMDFETTPRATNTETEDQTDNTPLGLLDPIRRRLARVLEVGSTLEKSEWFCVFYDVTDLLKHSLWTSDYSHISMKYLVQMWDDKDLHFTRDAYLVFILDCLRWPVSKNDAYLSDWIYGQLQQFTATHNGSMSSEVTFLFVHCCATGSERFPTKDWVSLTQHVQPALVESKNLAGHVSKFDSMHSSVLHTCADIVTARHGFLDQEKYLNADEIGVLLTWCGKNMESFYIEPDKMQANVSNHDDLLLQYSFSRLAQYMIRKWIEFTHKTVPGPTGLEWSEYLQGCNERQPWSDLVLFRAITRTLAFFSFLVVTKAKKYLYIPTAGGDDHKDRERRLQGVAEIFKSAIQELKWEHNEAFLRPSEHVPPISSSSNSDGIGESAEHSVEYAISMAVESYRLRQAPTSIRHGYTLSELPCETERCKSSGPPNGPNPTLYEFSSSSSLKSFSRSGIKLKDRFGPPSVSDKSSSIFTRLSSLSMSEWSPTFNEDGIVPCTKGIVEDPWDPSGQVHIELRFPSVIVDSKSRSMSAQSIS